MELYDEDDLGLNDVGDFVGFRNVFNRSKAKSIEKDNISLSLDNQGKRCEEPITVIDSSRMNPENTEKSNGELKKSSNQWQAGNKPAPPASRPEDEEPLDLDELRRPTRSATTAYDRQKFDRFSRNNERSSSRKSSKDSPPRSRGRHSSRHRKSPRRRSRSRSRTRRRSKSKHKRGSPSKSSPAHRISPRPPTPPPPSHSALSIPLNIHVPPPSGPPAHSPARWATANEAHKQAVENEKMQQKMGFVQQRNDYVQKRELLVKELSLAVQQRNELPPSRLALLEQNRKLQDDINKKIKSVDNVIDMLTDLIGPVDLREDPQSSLQGKGEKPARSSSSSSSSSSDSSGSNKKKRSKKRKKSSDGSKGRRKKEKDKYNLAFFDNEKHWCRSCSIFPKTAEDYLEHLHSQEHAAKTEHRKMLERPWHEVETHKERIFRSGLPTKTTAIKGVQFLVPTRGWYCKMCHCFMGDAHCVSLHLESKEHNDNYDEFTSKNPEWETKWLRERDLAERRFHYEVNQLQPPVAIPMARNEDAIGQRWANPMDVFFPVSKKPEGKKKSKKEKKKKRKYSSDSSSSSDTNSSSSSSEEDSSQAKKKKSKKMSEVPAKLNVTVPEKSKWEKDEEEEEFVRRQRSPEQPPNPILEAKNVMKDIRRYRWQDKEKAEIRSARQPLSPIIGDLLKLPEKHTILIPESTKSKKVESPKPISRPLVQKKEDTEAIFEKQAAASLAKKKPVPSILPKTKFGFIGRMPFARKKVEATDDGKKEIKEQDVATPDPTPPPPPVISKTVVVPQPAPPVLTAKTRLEIAKDIINKALAPDKRPDVGPMDPVMMEIDPVSARDSPPTVALPPSPPKIGPVLPPEVTKNLGKKTMAIPLPKEFQDALNIIYPEDSETIPLPSESKVAPPPPKITPPPPKVPPPPPTISPIMIPQPPKISEEITPPPPPSVNTFADDDMFIEYSPPSAPQNVFNPFSSKPTCFTIDDDDDMAMLGIDKEDMAAQKF